MTQFIISQIFLFTRQRTKISSRALNLYMRRAQTWKIHSTPTRQPLKTFLAQISTINFYVGFFNKNMSELSIFLLHLELAVAELIP